MKLYSSDVIGLKILELLGVSCENVTNAKITIEVGEPVFVDVRFIAGMNLEVIPAGPIFDVRKFKLVEVSQ